MKVFLLDRFPQLCVVLRISERLNSRYHCPFLYDDAEETVVEGLSQVQRQASGTRARRNADPSSAAASVGMTLLGGGGAEVLIHVSAIKTPRKPFHYSSLTISNRR